MAKRAAKETKRPTRRQARAEQVAKDRRNRLLKIWVPVGTLVVVVIGFVLFRAFEPDVEGLLTYSGLLRGHDAALVFPETSLPPTGGTHDPTWMNCGIYAEPVNTSRAVHSMEHGAVWITYQPGLDQGSVDVLRNLVRRNQFTLLSPYPGLQSPIVLSSWGRQLEITNASDSRIEEFIARYRFDSPESGAQCSQGAGIPLP